MPDQQDTQSILRELSDIKAALAVNTTETANIKGTVSEIKSDIKEIKNDFISRREHTEKYNEIVDAISPLQDKVDDLRLWQAKVLGMATAAAVVVDLIIRFIFK